MDLLRKILEKINGLHYKQEYLCFAAEAFEHPLHVYLVSNNEIIKDVTALHAFVGYCPVIFVLESFTEINESETIEVAFTPAKLNNDAALKTHQAIAVLHFKLLNRQKTGSDTILYFRAIEGHHHFTPSFKQAVGALYNRLYNKKPGNVFLEGNLYEQVQIAYSIPRKICLVTVGSNPLYNLFPTDLHGQVT